MRQRVKQAALTCALALPLVLTVAFSSPFTATIAAQRVMRMVGPRFPILIDNGDGIPGSGDMPFDLQQANSTTLQLSTLFSCGTQPNNIVTLSSPDPSGRFRTFSRRNNSRDQAITLTGTTGGAATEFSFVESSGTQVFASGTGALLDSNKDGAMDGIAVTSSIGSGAVPFVFTPDGGYGTIPAAVAAFLGLQQGRCGPPVGQVWVPLADTNGDGRGDTVVLDLDGNADPDPQYYTSPPVGGPATPTGPANLSATVTGQVVTLTWTAAANNPIQYTLQAGFGPGQTVIGIPLSGSTTSFTASAPPGIYYVRVVAVYADGSTSAPSNEIVVVVTTTTTTFSLFSGTYEGSGTPVPENIDCGFIPRSVILRLTLNDIGFGTLAAFYLGAPLFTSTSSNVTATQGPPGISSIIVTGSATFTGGVQTSSNFVFRSIAGEMSVFGTQRLSSPPACATEYTITATRTR